jgi:hypothetical protein
MVTLPDRTIQVWRLWNREDRDYPKVDEVHAPFAALFEKNCLHQVPSRSSRSCHSCYERRTACFEWPWNAVCWRLKTTGPQVSTSPSPFGSRAFLILLSNRRTRKRVKRGVDNDGRGARGGLVHVLGLHAIMQWSVWAPLTCVSSVQDGAHNVHVCQLSPERQGLARSWLCRGELEKLIGICRLGGTTDGIWGNQGGDGW